MIQKHDSRNPFAAMDHPAPQIECAARRRVYTQIQYLVPSDRDLAIHLQRQPLRTDVPGLESAELDAMAADLDVKDYGQTFVASVFHNSPSMDA